MRTILKQTILAAAIALMAMPVGTASARDSKLWLQVGPDGLQVQRPCDPDREDCGYNGRDRNDGGDREFRRRDHDDNFQVYAPQGCSPERALRKAERMGIYRARIMDVGRRTIDIAGGRNGRRVEVSFYRRDRSCPIAY